MKKYLFILFIFYSCDQNNTPVAPINIDVDLSTVFLTATEMQGFELIRQSSNDIIINDKRELHKVIEQKWHILEEDDDLNIHIYYCIFENSIEAFRNIAYAATRSNEWPYIWGSVSGSIIKDGSWISVISYDAIHFIRGNVGIKVFIPLQYDEKSQKIILDVCAKLQKKIECNLKKEIVDFEESLKLKQIKLNEYQISASSLINYKLMNNFYPTSTWDSKWLVDSVKMAMGIRHEWKNENGAVIGIDLCKFESEKTASNAGKIMSYNTWREDHLFQSNDPASLKQIISAWKKNGIENNISVVTSKGNIGYHIYYYDPIKIDTDFFIKLFKF